MKINTIFDDATLKTLAQNFGEKFRNAEPFPYVAIDNFMDPVRLLEAVKAFPTPEQLEFYKYDNPLEKKLAMDQISKLPDPIAEILLAMNAPQFLNFLEQLTGIEGLVPDPYYRGGGIHQSVNGGKLDIHIDFNLHPKLKLERRLNAIIYLNENWQESYHGDFQIWEGHRENGKHVLDRLVDRVYPIFNRFVVFATSEKSYHGFPEPIECPDHVTRKSMALYYYTADRPVVEQADPHSTTFIKLPTEDDSLDELRETRNKGRLVTNIVTENLK